MDTHVSMCMQDVREHLRLWHGFVASWKEEEHVRTKTIFKELNGWCSPRLACWIHTCVRV